MTYLIPIGIFVIAVALVLIVIPALRRDEKPLGAPVSDEAWEAQWAEARARQRRQIGSRRHGRVLLRTMAIRYGRRMAYIRAKIFKATNGRR